MLRPSFILALCGFFFSVAFVGSSYAVDFDNGGGDGNWNTGLNWTDNTVPNLNNVFIGETVAGPITVAITASPLNPINELGLGRALTGTFTINHSAGDLITNSWTNIGQSQAGVQVGIYNLSGGSVTKNGAGNNVFGGFGNARGELHITNNGLWKINTGFTAIGGETTAASTTVGIITVADTGRFENTNGTVYVGRGGTGTFTHDSSNTSTMRGLEIANLSQGMGTVEVSNGTIAIGNLDIQIGRGNTTNTPILDINNIGKVTHAANTVIGRDGRGIIDISGSGDLQTNWLIVGEGGANVSAQLKLSDSATLSTTRLTLGNGGATNGLIQLTGSGLTASTNLLDVLTNGSNTFRWVADADGVSALNVNGNVQLGNANLIVDLTDIASQLGTAELIDYTGALTGNFDSIVVLYDGIMLDPGVAGSLNNFQYSLSLGDGTDDSVVLAFQLLVPEPASIGLWLLGFAFGVTYCILRRKRAVVVQ